MNIIILCVLCFITCVIVKACPDNCQCSRDQTECYIFTCDNKIDLMSTTTVIHGLLCVNQYAQLEKLSGDMLIILKNDICHRIKLCKSEVRRYNCLPNCKCNHYLNECFIKSCADNLELNIDTLVIHRRLCDSHKQLLLQKEGVHIILTYNIWGDISQCISKLPISSQMTTLTIHTTVVRGKTIRHPMVTDSTRTSSSQRHPDTTTKSFDSSSQRHPGTTITSDLTVDLTADSSATSDKELAAKYK